MPGTDIKDAATLLKNAQRDLTIQENNLASIQQKVSDLIRQKETIQKQIDEKVSNTNIMLSEQRGKLEVERAFVQSEREKLSVGKIEVDKQIEVLRSERSAFEKEKEAAKFTLDKAKYLRGNVDQFIVAVKRAYDVLGS